MATYKYQQNFYDGSMSAAGYVKFNITPDLGTSMSPGETGTITGEVYNNKFAIKSIVATLNAPSGQVGGRNSGVNKSISKGRTGTFTIRFAIPSDISAWITSGRYADCPLTFGVWSGVDATGTELFSEPYSGQSIRYLGSRIAPSVYGVAFSDNAGLLNRFGSYIQGYSDLTVSFTEVPDPADSSVTIVRRVLALNGEPYELESNSHRIGRVNLSGTVDWMLAATDSKDNIGTAKGSISMLAYYAPRLTNLSVQRYRTDVADDGATSYVADEAGERVWLSFSLDVMPISSANAWSLSVIYGPEGGTTRTATLHSGTDGSTFSTTNNRFLLTAAIPASDRYTFRFTLADSVTTTERVIVLEKSGALFNVEKYGVAVGQRSTGEALSKKFEVAEDYIAHFYGGAMGADGRRFDLNFRKYAFDDADYAAGFTNYNATNHQVIVARAGAVVHISGIIRSTAVWDSTSPAAPLTLPPWAWPHGVVHAVQQGTSTYQYWLRIYPDGTLYLERYRNGSENYTSVPAGAQFTVSATWIAGDVYGAESSSYSVDSPSGAAYGFSLGADGYYASQNAGVDASYAIARVSLRMAEAGSVQVTYINNGEANYDYGLIGLMDTALTLSSTADTSVAVSCKSVAPSDTAYTYTFSGVSAGEHFFDVKYVKDGSMNGEADYFKFKLEIL